MSKEKSEKHSFDAEPATHWASIREAGTLFGLQFLRWVHTVFGRKAVSILLLPTVAYFVLLRPYSRRSSYDYLRRHHTFFPQQWKQSPRLRDVVRHFREFAETVVDKLLSWFIDIDADQFVIATPGVVDELLRDSRGQLIIGSHFGNLEYCRGFMHRYRDKVINILVHDKHAENYNTLMRQLNAESRLNVFQVSEFDIPTMLLLKKKVDAGEWLFIAGDRIPVNSKERTVEVEFMGSAAQFPIGPYMLAKGLGCPVKLMFSYRNYHQQDTEVHFEVVDFSDRLTLQRGAQRSELQQYAQRFAHHLQAQCEQAPFQWFNFYQFWAEPENRVS